MAVVAAGLVTAGSGRAEAQSRRFVIDSDHSVAGLPLDRKELGLAANARWNRPHNAVGAAMMSDSVDIVLQIIEEDNGPAAELRYLGHSGWRLVTEDHVLLFDWVEGEPELTPALLAHRTLVVLVSHQHADHYADGLLAEVAELPRTHFVLGWDGPDLPNRTVLPPREFAQVAGLEIRTTASTDLGVGFLVQLPGLTVFHAGDHANWSEASTDAYRREIDWLAESAPRIDVALLPVATGARCETNETLRDGALYAMEVLAPAMAIPMHVRCPDRYGIYADIRDAAAEAVPGVEVLALERLGQIIDLAPLMKRQE